MNLLHLIRPDLKNFQPYRSAKNQSITGKIWLDANESPWDHALTTYPDVLLNRYPDAQPSKLIEMLARYYATSPKNIFITHGSDAAIDLLMRLFCIPEKDKVVVCPPTFSMYEIFAQLQGAVIVSIPLKKEAAFQLDVTAIKQVAAKLIFLCSPNNPTGNLLKEADILDLCEAFLGKGFVVVDEAYIEYAARNSLTSKISEYENLIVLRTFSKALGLAGIRCGTLIAQEAVINWLNKIALPYPLSGLTQSIALQALQPPVLEKNRERIRLIQTERERLYLYFSEHPSVERVWPSEANFLFIEVEDADRCMVTCLKNGIVPRLMPPQAGLKNAIRVSVGLSHENDLLMHALQNI